MAILSLTVVIVAGCIAAFLVLRTLYRASAARAAAMQAVISALEQHFPFKNQSPGGILPNLYAKIDGMKTAVDVTYQSYERGVNQASGRRPFTRVRVQLASAPPFEVRTRAEGSPAQPGHREFLTGDAPFDQRYVVLAASEEDAALATPEVRRAFVGAQQSVSLIDKFVIWMKRNHVRDPQLMLDAVQSCIDVAAALKPGLPAAEPRSEVPARRHSSGA